MQSSLASASLLVFAALATSGCASQPCAHDDAAHPPVAHVIEPVDAPRTPAAPMSGIDLLWPNGEGGEPCVIP